MSKPWSKYRDSRIVYSNMLRAKTFNTSGEFTLEEWLDLCLRHDNKCAHCKASVPLTADHMVPLSKGGTNDIGNIQPLCKPCNSRKGTSMPGIVFYVTCTKCGGNGPFLPHYHQCEKCLSKVKSDWYQKNKDFLKRRRDIRKALTEDLN